MSQDYFQGKDGFIWWHGVVEDRKDPLMIGRCRVRILGWHTADKAELPTSNLPWAYPIMPITSASQTNVGEAPVGPVEGTWVMGYYRDGELAQEPVMVGTLHGIPERYARQNTGFYDSRLDTPDKNRQAMSDSGKSLSGGPPATMTAFPFPPKNIEIIHAQGCDFWPVAMARELEDAILHLRFNEPELGTWILKTSGASQNIAAADQAMYDNSDHWLIREITLYLKRTFKRLDVSSRSIIALITPGSCFTGTLMELALSADISYMLDGTILDSDIEPATVRLTNMNFGPLIMCNGLSRIESRFLCDNKDISKIRDKIGEDLTATEAENLGIVTFIPDDIDWEDEVRVAIEARASFSPDALTAMEANLRFGGPETMESKIFSRLSAWQNWVFLRKNAGNSLQLYGSGKKPKFERERI